MVDLFFLHSRRSTLLHVITLFIIMTRTAIFSEIMPTPLHDISVKAQCRIARWDARWGSMDDSKRSAEVLFCQMSAKYGLLDDSCRRLNTWLSYRDLFLITAHKNFLGASNSNLQYKYYGNWDTNFRQNPSFDSLPRSFTQFSLNHLKIHTVQYMMCVLYRPRF